jgi:tRNA 2-thiouridine synthesizing protein A
MRNVKKIKKLSKKIIHTNNHKEVLDATGLKCPEPILQIAVKSADMKDREILEVFGDCPTFESDVKMWCKRLHKTLLWMREEEGGKKHCQIQF